MSDAEVNPISAGTAAKYRKKLDINKIRSDFPVLDQQVHGVPLVYLDSAASNQMPVSVIERVNHYHRHEHANVHRGIHTLSNLATRAMEDARDKVKEFINAGAREEIVWTYGTTDAINLVANTFGRMNFRKGDEIILTEMEHHANIVPWQIVAGQVGAVIKVIPMDDHGVLQFDGFTRLIGPKTRLLAITQISNVLGTVNPVKKYIEVAHEHDVPVLVDGAQSAPHMHVDVQDLDCDFFAFSGHKIYGPTGVGVLYGKRHWLDEMPPYRGGGEMIDRVTFEQTTYNETPYKFEAGTPPIAAAIGMGTAIDYIREMGFEAMQEHEHDLLQYATERLLKIDGLRIIGTAPDKASIISFMLKDIHPHDIGTLLDQQGIAIRTGHHCAQPLMDRMNIPATARASFSIYNTRDEVDKLIDGLKMVQRIFA
jgi:cysteine desulfurase/selenocysteine lyase